LNSSEPRRLSVAQIDVTPGHEKDFDRLSTAFAALLLAKNYGRAEMIPDESVPQRFYAVRHWTSADAAAQCHVDSDAQAITTQLYKIARVIQVVNGVRTPDPMRRFLEDRRARVEADRRTGFERRKQAAASGTGVERRSGRDRRLGPRRLRDRPGAVDLVAAARRARQFAEAAYSNFQVGAALEAADGTVVTGCNIENATYGLTICAERVAMFKALSEGLRAFTRIAIVADTEAPTPPCGACRQILWEFGGNLEIQLANMQAETGRHQLRDLLPLPFDARLLL
jgi:cytidine deaminase